MERQGKREESPQEAPKAWIFDVDGVITNPREKKVTEKGLISAIAERLQKGEIVALNTGRSISWMMDRVIKPIEESVGDKKYLDKFTAVGEKGGSWLSHQNGEWVTSIDETISVPKSLQDEVRDLVNSQFRDSMFYDESKLTMISTEMIDGLPIEDYSRRQKAFVEEIKEILSSPEYKGLDLKIDPTTIATDIQNAHVGKHLGARRIAQRLKGEQHIIAIGDSQSDTEMAEELQEEYLVDFVFVGDPVSLNSDKLKNKPIFTTKRFDAGTLEFLQSFN